MLKGTLLVPVENLQSNCNFMWVGTLNSSNNHVDVIAFKTAKKDDFVSLMKADAESLQTMEQTPNVKFIRKIDKTFIPSYAEINRRRKCRKSFLQNL